MRLSLFFRFLWAMCLLVSSCRSISFDDVAKVFEHHRQMQSALTGFQQAALLHMQELMSRMSSEIKSVDAARMLLNGWLLSPVLGANMRWKKVAGEEHRILVNNEGRYVDEEGFILPEGLAFREGCWVVQDQDGNGCVLDKRNEWVSLDEFEEEEIEDVQDERSPSREDDDSLTLPPRAHTALGFVRDKKQII